MDNNTTKKDYTAKERLDILSGILLERKVEDLVILKVGDLGAFCEYFIIGSVNSERQAKALYDYCLEKIHKLHWFVYGRDCGESFKWLVFDFNDIVVHIFLGEARQYYDLENLWCAAERVEVSVN